MTTITDFPADVQEILIFMRDNTFLSTIYKGSDKNTEIVTNIHRALEIYTDQDTKKPYYFLQEIFSSAQKKIEIPPPPNYLEKFAIHRDSENYYEKIINNNKHLIMELGIDDDDYEFLINIFYEDLLFCAKSRLFSEEKIDFFERVFKIYKSSGFPCGWKSSSNPNKGSFLVYSKN